MDFDCFRTFWIIKKGNEPISSEDAHELAHDYGTTIHDLMLNKVIEQYAPSDTYKLIFPYPPE